MEPSILSLLPPVVTIGLAIATGRILLALGIGVVLGALMYSQWNILDSVSLIAEVAGGLIIAEGAIAEEMYILAFVVLLGVLTSFIYISGGLQAVSEWAITKVKTRFQAQLVPYVLGIVIFFDDAFSSLVGGNVSRTITDPHRISRAKLSYIVDSTAAPVIILVPISGWAAFIAATMTDIFNRNEVTAFSGYEAFLGTIPTTTTPSPRSSLCLLLHISGSTSARCARMKDARSMKGTWSIPPMGSSLVRLTGTCQRERMARLGTWSCRWRRSSASP